MNELYRTIEAAFAAAPEGKVRELISKALDILDTTTGWPTLIVPSPDEIMAKVERVRNALRVTLARAYRNAAKATNDWDLGDIAGLKEALSILTKEFPDDAD